MIEDCDAWMKYPQHHNWFNKLWVAEKFGYTCGPAGTDIPKSGTYVVRPIYNLGGMGAKAQVMSLPEGDYSTVPPGYFWCEYFNGTHYSVNYEWKWDRDTINGEWIGTSCWAGINMPINLTKFTEWKRSDYIPPVPVELNELNDVNEINVEFIDHNIIEVHLRESPDPEYDHMIPIWESDLGRYKHDHYEIHGYKWIEAYDNANGYIDDPRIGFYVK